MHFESPVARPYINHVRQTSDANVAILLSCNSFSITNHVYTNIPASPPEIIENLLQQTQRTKHMKASALLV